MILGVCGRRKHGKDSFAKRLIECDRSFTKLAFAARLKEICMKLYGLTEYQVTDEAGKEKLLSAPIALDDQIEALRQETGLAIQPHGLVAVSPREVLQYVGTDYVRSVAPDYWRDIVVTRLQDNPNQNFVVTDVRFANEAEALRTLGGKVVRVLRLAQVDNDKASQHASEKLDFKPDYTLATVEGDLGLFTVVGCFSRNGLLWDALGAANYDTFCFMGPYMVGYYGNLFPELCKLASEALDKPFFKIPLPMERHAA